MYHFKGGGVITFNAAAAETMELKPEDKISLMQDEDHPENWYFFKDPKGFAMRTAYDKKGLLFNHSALRKTFIEALEFDMEKSHNFIIAGEPTIVKGDKTKYWCVLIVRD